jgi:hypothetical protein
MYLCFGVAHVTPSFTKEDPNPFEEPGESQRTRMSYLVALDAPRRPREAANASGTPNSRIVTGSAEQGRAL